MNKRTWGRSALAIIIGAGVYTALIYLLVKAESGVPDAGIKSVSDAIWYSIVTLTTVGYGDFYPITPWGKIIGYVFVISSLGVLGYLIGKINSLIAEMRESRHLGYKGTSFQNHTVIIGWNQFAGSITQELVNANIEVAIVTDNINDLELIKEKYDKKLVYVLLSDLNNFQLIEKTNITSANSVFINIDDDTEKLVYFLNASKYFGNKLDYVLISNDSELKNVFADAGVSCVLSVDEFASKIIGSYIFEPDVAEYVEDILSSAVNENDYDIIEYRITTDNPYIGHKYNSVFFQIKEDYDAILIGIVKISEKGERNLIKNPNDPELVLGLGDFLIVIANGAVAEQLSLAFNVSEGLAGDQNN